MREKFKFHKDGLYLMKLLHQLDRSAIFVSASAAILEAVIPYVGLWLSAVILDSLLAGAWRQAGSYAAILVISNLVLGFLINQLAKMLGVKYQMLYTDLKILMRKKALSMTFERFENPEVSRKIYLAERTIDMYGGLEQVLYLYQQLLMSLVSGITAIGMVGHMCLAKGNMSQRSVWISVISFVIVAILIIKTTLYSSANLLEKQNNIFVEHGDTEDGLSYFMEKVYGNQEANKVTHLYKMKDMIMENFNRFLHVSVGLYRRMRTVRRWQEMVSQGISAVFTIYSYGLILIKIWGQAISIGSFSKYAGATTKFMDDMTNIVWTNGEIARKCEFMQGLIEFMKMEEESWEGTLPIKNEPGKDYEIEFHNVSFRYPGNEELTLKNLNCKINSKDKTAIVGQNGAGKTTFIKLLCGLYQPTEGIITLNGVDIREYEYQDYINLFGVVFQDFALFAFPVGQNIAASQEWNEEKVWKCLEKAEVDNVIEKLPKKLETYMFQAGESGVNVSGGEMQKLAIARALYKDAPIMILDEPTAALDPISEYEIYKRFDDLVKNKTSIFITHRMSSCRFCDDVIVFADGQIKERGSHEELLKNQALYAKMWNAQANYYQEA